MKECESCEGIGAFSCCGGFVEPGWPDTDICAGCYEHSGEDCEECNGEGFINE